MHNISKIKKKGDDEGEKGQQQRQQRLELLDRLAAEKKQLEQKKLELQVSNTINQESELTFDISTHAGEAA